MAVEGGTRCIKYLLFIFNLLFLLAGLVLIIIGAVVAAKLSAFSSIANVQFNGAGIFIIVIGLVVFIIAFFGCLGAYKENYCLLIIFIILMAISLLALIAAIITAFVMRNKVGDLLKDGYRSSISKYSSEAWLAKLWNEMQQEFRCCGAERAKDWVNDTKLSPNEAVPDSCCKNMTEKCGYGQTRNPNYTVIYETGCANATEARVFSNMVAVGGAAAAIAILQFIGMLFAGCLARALRKEYQTV